MVSNSAWRANACAKGSVAADCGWRTRAGVGAYGDRKDAFGVSRIFRPDEAAGAGGIAQAAAADYLCVSAEISGGRYPGEFKKAVGGNAGAGNHYGWHPDGRYAAEGQAADEIGRAHV